MKTEHAVSIELCKKLTSIGFPETEKIMEVLPSWWINHIYDSQSTRLSTDEYFPEYVCPSVMEMLDVIPDFIKAHNDEYWFSMTKGNAKYAINRDEYYDEEFFCGYWTLQNALAEMVIWLHENKYITF